MYDFISWISLEAKRERLAEFNEQLAPLYALPELGGGEPCREAHGKDHKGSSRDWPKPLDDLPDRDGVRHELVVRECHFLIKNIRHHSHFSSPLVHLLFSNEIHESHTLCCPLRLLVDMRFQIYFTPLTGVLFTFPSRY